MSQSLGLHRASAVHAHDQIAPDTHVPIFWLIYILDKGLALRLGRASNIHDFDVNLPRGLHCAYNRPSTAQFAKYIDVWIGMAQTQGNLYRDLYSPYALSLPQHVRATNAQSLAEDLIKTRAELRDIYVSLSCVP